MALYVVVVEGLVKILQHSRKIQRAPCDVLKFTLYCGLSDLHVGQTAKVQDLQHLLSVMIYSKDLLIQGLRPQEHKDPSLLSPPPAV